MPLRGMNFCSEAPVRDVFVWSEKNVVLCRDVEAVLYGNAAPARANTELRNANPNSHRRPWAT